MSIKQRGKGFEAYVAKGDKRYRKIFKSHEDAAQWEAKIKLALLEGRDPTEVYTPSGSWTLGQAVDETYKAIWQGSKGASTAYKNSMACISFFGANVSLSAITTLELQNFVSHLKEQGNSNATCNRKLAALSRCMSYARQCNKLNVMPHIPRQKEAQGRLRWLSDVEEQRMLAIADAWSLSYLRDAIVILVDTGIRVGELLKLRCEDVYDDRIVLIDTKNHKTHVVPLTNRASETLSKLKTLAVQGEVYPTSYETLQAHFNRATEHLEMDGVTIHTLRHTFASRLVQKGVPLQVVSTLLNHTTLTMTMRYAHLAPLNLTDAISKLEPVA